MYCDWRSVVNAGQAGPQSVYCDWRSIVSAGQAGPQSVYCDWRSIVSAGQAAHNQCTVTGPDSKFDLQLQSQRVSTCNGVNRSAPGIH